MLEQHECFRQVFRQVGAIEIVIKYMHDFEHSHAVVDMCHLVILQFPAEYVPFILSCGIERIIFTRMQKLAYNVKVQTNSMVTLAWFYRNGSHAFDSFQDLFPLTLIFNATQKFMHEDDFFRAAVYLLSILMVDREIFEIQHRFVQMGYVQLIASRMQSILKPGPIMPADELLYTNLTRILCSIAMFPHLHTSVACPSIKVSLEAGMLIFPHNVDVLLATCNLFRLVFFPLSDVRRPTPALSIVVMVLCAISENYNEHLLHVECILTLDVLMNSRQVLNFVSQQNGFDIINRTLYRIIGVGSTSAAKVKMASQFPHTLQSEFVLASFSLLSKLPLCDNSTDCFVVKQIMRQHKTEIRVQNSALYMLDKYMLPNSNMICRFRLGGGVGLVRSAIELPDLSPASHAIAQKIICVCSFSPKNL